MLNVSLLGEPVEEKDHVMHDIVYGLARHLPLVPWKSMQFDQQGLDICIDDGCQLDRMKIDSKKDFLSWADMLKTCCPRVRVIGPKNALQTKQLKQVFGMGTKTIDLKRNRILSAFYPFNKLSLLYQREMGIVAINQTLVENMTRCDLAKAICDYLEPDKSPHNVFRIDGNPCVIDAVEFDLRI